MKKWIQYGVLRRALLLAWVLAVAWPAGAAAQEARGEAGLKQVQREMVERLPKLEALKQAGKVGETNQGFLAPRGELTEKEAKLVEEENADRALVYAVIAERAGQSAAAVGKQRAAQIAKRSEPGLWLQDAKGRWYRKEKP